MKFHPLWPSAISPKGAILTVTENLYYAFTKPSDTAKVAPSEAQRNVWGRCRALKGLFVAEGVSKKTFTIQPLQPIKKCGIL